MKKACLFVSQAYTKNKIFSYQDIALNRDDVLRPYRHLKTLFEKNGFSIDTQDICSPEQADVVIYLDLQDESELPTSESLKKKCILVISECEVIYPHNWTVETHAHFSRILTWNPTYWDGRKYFETRFPILLQTAFFNRHFNRKRLVTLIAGNKLSRRPLELYSKRREAICWFERHHPEHFEFYGLGWDRFASRFRKITAIVNRLGLSSFLRPRFKSYQGPVKSKFEVLSQYRFAICFENAEKIPGYITEKIFDCFSCGTIPIYWGAPDILEHVPAECFIDFRNFKDYEDLHQFLLTIDSATHARYMDAIWSFMHSEKIKPFLYPTVNQNTLAAAQAIVG
ncbi:MAG: hypothetical protein KF681_13130 [Bdellovibrionaceae bacterium]|nr:hypothetical protein [Pseudobdellovibrionaceae bacterium]